MSKIQKIALLLIAGLLAPSMAAATDVLLINPGDSGSEAAAAGIQANVPQFFFALVAGLLLAIGFQLLLTCLSVAAGISFLPNMEKRAGKEPSDVYSGHGPGQTQLSYVSAENTDSSRATTDTSSDRLEENESSKSSNKDHMLVKLSTGAGIWTMITASISLFFASLLAVSLGFVPAGTGLGVILGLAIWAAFFAILAYVETKSVYTLVGGVMHTALSGLRHSASAIQTAFGKSAGSRIEDIADHTIDRVRDEVSSAVDRREIDRKMEHYIQELKPQEIDPRDIRRQLAKLIDEIEIEEHYEHGDEGIEKHLFLKVLEEQPNLSKEDAKKLKGVFHEVMDARKAEGSNADKVMTGVDKLTPGTEDEAKAYRERLEEYLRSTNHDELNPDRIKEDVNRMFEDPKAAPEIIRARLNSLDRESAIALLSARDNIDHERAEKIVGQVEGAMNYVSQKLGQRKAEKDVKKTQAQGAAAGKKQDMKARARLSTEEKEGRIANFLNSIGRPEFNYYLIRRDFERMFEDPKATPDILRERLGQYDRDSLVALLASRKDMTEEEANEVVNNIEQARDNALHKAHKIDLAVREKYYQGRSELFHQMEGVRRSASVAAWWLFGTAVISGACAALGGMFAMSWNFFG